MKLLILSLLPAFAFGQVHIIPAAPVAAARQQICITADRPVLFHLSGAGAINVARGTTTTYTAPANITAPATLDGCMTSPSDSVFNTRVDRLPVAQNSSSWTPFVTADGVRFSSGWTINLVNSSAQISTASTAGRRLLLLNPTTCQFYESGRTYKSADYQQPAGSIADPSGLPLAALILHLSELENGSVNHALRFTGCAECFGYQATWPAIASNGLQPGAPPMGTRFRLKANFDISTFSPAARTVLTALQRYGMILAAAGPAGEISVASDVTANASIYRELQSISDANLSYTDFEVVDESSLQLMSGSYAANPANPYQQPSNYATLTVTDAANPRDTLIVPIALEPAGTGTPAPAMPATQTESAALLTAHAIQSQAAAGVSSPLYTLQQFDSACGQPGYNCQKAFQLAFAALTKTGGGTLQLPAGVFTVDFPGVPQNILSGAPIPQNSLLVVPANTTVQGHLAANGAPDSIIEWKITSIPVFLFNKSSHSGLQNLHLRFTGTMPRAFPFGDVALLKALGYHPTFPHLNQMSGDNAELFSFAYVLDSDYCTFNNLLFDSATQDNNHIFNMAINMKGKGVIQTNGGGLTQLAESNRITNIQVYDFMNAFLVGGQDSLVIQNITADRRGSAPDTAPGHVLYTTGTNQFDASANVVNLLLSTNTTIQGITEGPHTYSNVVAGGTLAIKCLNGAQISNVTSQHPEGLIQTLYIDQNVTFTNLSWTSNYPLCANVPSNCSTPVINSNASPANMPPMKNLTFRNISLTSTASPASVTLIGDNLQVNGLQITTLPDFLPGQIATNSILNIRNTSRALIAGYTYTPVLQTYNPKQKYNSPFTGWNTATNVTASITLNWPKSIKLPAAGSTIVTSGFQSQGAGSNNSATMGVALQ